ncbi:hypothetical protein EB155_12825, partial [archaeon]|nr:hypothetical protein [archaeon]NDB56610.1 hypothetical protein [archaeon]NDB80736.1 hypothetical protein [archaeon]
MEITTLSSFPGVPFNDTFETFFDTHTLGEDIDCYQLLFCPYGNGSSFEDLYKIKFQNQVVILNMMDLMIDNNDNTAIDELTKFCETYPEHNFIVFNLHPGIERELKISNLYLDSIISTNFTENLKHCEKKKISNRWLSLNRDTKVHRVLTISYLLSKDYYQNGDITFDMEASTLVTPDKYKNITTGLSAELKKDLARGFSRFKSKDFNLLKIRNFDKSTDRVASNYNQNLLPLYQTTGVEIITGTMFFEKSPVFSEKEIQPVYGKNFPIYINGVGIVREMKKLFDIDTFDDIVDNSYDEIEDHFERMAAAID